MKSILITGANGVIGCNVLKLLAAGNKFNLFAMHFSSAQNIQNIPGITLIEADLTKPISLNKNIDVVIHCAAALPLSFNDTKAADANRTIDDNVISFSLASNARLIYCSTASIYHAHPGPWNEKEEVDPANPYPKQKLLSEKKIISELKEYVILRINAPFHYLQKNNTVLKKFIINAINGADLVLYGSGKREQNFINAEDIAQLILKIISSNIKGIYNVGGKKNISMHELAKKVLLLTGSNSAISYANLPDDNENIVPSLDTSLIREKLNLDYNDSLDEGIKKWIAALKNEDRDNF